MKSADKDKETLDAVTEEARRADLRRRRSHSAANFYSGAAAVWRSLGNIRQAMIWDSRAASASEEAERLEKEYRRAMQIDGDGDDGEN